MAGVIAEVAISGAVTAEAATIDLPAEMNRF
jgi:hypothetical protein